MFWKLFSVIILGVRNFRVFEILEHLPSTWFGVPFIPSVRHFVHHDFVFALYLKNNPSEKMGGNPGGIPVGSSGIKTRDPDWDPTEIPVGSRPNPDGILAGFSGIRPGYSRDPVGIHWDPVGIHWDPSGIKTWDFAGSRRDPGDIPTGSRWDPTPIPTGFTVIPAG